jgi:acetolactate decarboxylase
MRIALTTVIGIFLLMGTICGAESKFPFDLRYYGSFKKMLHTKNVEGVVGLKQALSGDHVYAVGALKNAAGEITLHDSETWLSYGRESIEASTHHVPKDEQAMLLVTAIVNTWRDIVIPADMAEHELHLFILSQAEKYGLSTNDPFPFLIEGPVKDMTWHVIAGIQPESEGHGDHAFIRRLIENKQLANALLVGFYSGEIRGAFTHPGESWHTHVIFTEERKAGHVESFSVGKGATLRIPVK